MLQLASKTALISEKQENVYNYLADFKNFAHLLPAERLKDIEITGDTLKFAIDGIGKIGLRISEYHPYEQLVIQALEGTAADFTLWINIAAASPESSRVHIDLKASLNLFLEMVARGPLQQFLDMIVDKLGEIEFIRHEGA